MPGPLMHLPTSSPLLTPSAVPTPIGAALLHLARSLRTMARSGSLPPMLNSKYVGLLSIDHHPPSQDAVADAARGLGARVAWVPPMTVQIGPSAEARETARLLGRLYDALDCEGLPPALVQCLHRDSGVPVYEGLGRKNHPLVHLLPLLDAEQAQALGTSSFDEDEGHRCLLQAMLVHTLL